MKRFRSCLVIGLIFLSGFLVGGFIGAAFGWVGFFHKVVKGGPGAVRTIIVERAVQDLKLKPDQQAAVKKIVEETALELSTATAEVRPKIEEIMGRAEARTRAVLDVKQRGKFDRFAEQGRQRWKAFHEKGAAERAAPPSVEPPGAR